MNNRAYYFSVDAFIALLIILSVVFFIKPPTIQPTHEVYIQEDLLSVLSSLKIGEINNTYVKQLISNGNITNTDQSVLDQIGEFYARSDPAAQILSQNIMNNLNLTENIGLYFNNNPMAVSGTLNTSNATNIITARDIISGIQNGTTATGYSSRAFLASGSKIDYFYFGGYIGEGIITAKITGDIIGANIEGVFSENFNISINNQSAGTYVPTPGVPFKSTLVANLSLFNNGDNYIDFKASNSSHNLYIAGGFVKVTYNNSAIPSTSTKKNLPGINGIINLYDGFYVPGTLNNMEVFLHYNSSYDIFMRVGDKIIYSGNSSNSGLSVLLNNANLSSVLNYSKIVNKTIPLRLGLVNASYISNYTIPSDVFSVSDLSGSMCSCNVSGGGTCTSDETKCGSYFSCTRGVCVGGINESRRANIAFVQAVLNSTNISTLNRVGLVGYSNNVNVGDCQNLTNNATILNNTILSWRAVGGTCICCGINEAVNRLNNQSYSNRSRSIVVMSDGQANRGCTGFLGNEKQDAIDAACRAYNNYGIKVYAIGFGPDADQNTLRNISINCGHGNYYYGNISQIVGLYQQIAHDVVTASYSEQTILAQGINTRLYPDSYISFNYTRSIPYGLILTAETPIFNNSFSIGNFNVSDGSQPYDIRVVSYSGSRWTSRVSVYNKSSLWEPVYDLADYNLTFTNLGDPYVVNVPVEKISQGNNSIRVYEGLSTVNYTAGSLYNKIIYTLVKNASSFTPVLSSANGCLWHVRFESSGLLYPFLVPANYSGPNNCYYIPGLFQYNDNDAIDVAIFNLLKSLDLDSNGKVDATFNQNALTVSSVQITGIPFTWDTEVQARVWS